METHETTKQSVPPFHSGGFACDKTDASIEKLIQAATVKSELGSYFGWKGVLFQCGCLLTAVPSHVTFTVNNWLMMMDSELTKMIPAEEPLADMRKKLLRNCCHQRKDLPRDC